MTQHHSLILYKYSIILTDQLSRWLSLATTMRTELAVLFQHDYLGNTLYSRVLSYICVRFGLQGFNMKGSEHMTVVGTEVCIGHVLEILRMTARGGPLSLRLDHDRDSIVSNTSSASYAHGCHPNSYFVVNERLLLVGDYKVNSDEVPLAYGNAMNVNILCVLVASCAVFACGPWC